MFNRRRSDSSDDRFVEGILKVVSSCTLMVVIFPLIGASALPLLEQHSVGEQQTVTVGIYPSPPKVFWNEAGEPDGFFPELIEYIAQQEGWTLEPVACDWPDCLEAVERGELDLMVDVSYSQKRDARFDFNREVVFPSWSVVFARPGNRIESVLDLHDKRIAVLADGIQCHVSLKEQRAQPLHHFHPRHGGYRR
jgi:ABC-type amino acid transport substrate-binding protein